MPSPPQPRLLRLERAFLSAVSDAVRRPCASSIQHLAHKALPSFDQLSYGLNVPLPPRDGPALGARRMWLLDEQFIERK